MMAELIDWQEKYVNYVEGDLQKDIQELKDGQKTLDAGFRREIKDLDTGLRKEIRDLDTCLRKEIKDLDTCLRKEIKDLDTGLRKEIKDLDTGLREEIKDLGKKVDRLLYIIAGAALVALIGGLIRIFVQ